jgi:uncharacterized peroxidase-related enzyme
VTHHRRGLRRLLKDDDLASKIEGDFETAGLSDRRTQILRFSVKLTETPAAMTAEDVLRLREAGLGDRDILHVVEVVSYYAYVNRIADGLGVPLEEWIDDTF